MRMKEMGERMGEMGMGESIGNFYMRVGIFVSMYCTFPYLIPPKRSFLEKTPFLNIQTK